MEKITNNYSLKVEKTLLESHDEPIVQYAITEDAVPLFEVNRWLQNVSFNSYLTGKQYAYVLVNYLRYLKAHKRHYRDVTSKVIIENYIKFLLYGDKSVSLIEGKKSMNSIKQHISIIKGFYEWLEDQGEIQDNPVTYGFKRNKKTNRQHLKSKFLYGQIWDFEIEKSLVSNLKYKRKQSHVKWYTDDEIENIFFKLPSVRDKLIFKITLETGMRIGEVLGLHFLNFDSNEGILTVRKNANPENEAIAKTTERDLYISDKLVDELSIYIRSERAENDLFFSDYLFLNHKGTARGKPVTTRNFLAILKRAGIAAGFEGTEIRTHSGRSTHAQKLLDSLHEGKITEIYIIQQMGWENISTIKPYTRTYNEKNRKRIAKEIVEKSINLPSVINNLELESTDEN